MMAQARRNAEGAQRELVAANLAGAYTLLWGALRQAIAAHMQLEGLRATAAPGHHAAVVAYARARLEAVIGAENLAAADRIRRTRHLSEYEARPLMPGQVEVDLAIVDRVTRLLAETLDRTRLSS